MTWDWLSPIGGWITAASTGAISAWVLNWLRDVWNRPVLQLAIDLKGGSVVQMDMPPTRYARVIVRNRGRTLARSCCVFVDYIRRTDPAGSPYVFHSDLLDLQWSLLRSDTTVLNIASGGYRLLDVAFTSDGDPPKFCIAALLPNRLIPELKMNALYEIHMLAYADNASSKEFSCRIAVGATHTDLTIERCDDPRPLQERGTKKTQWYLRPFAGVH
jgi:hypothetical protein